jgi:hypothetical protein
VIGWTTKWLVVAFILGSTVTDTRWNIHKYPVTIVGGVHFMAKIAASWLMNRLWDNSRMGWKMAKARSFLPTGARTQVIGLTIRNQVKAFLFSLMVIGTRWYILKMYNRRGLW